MIARFTVLDNRRHLCARALDIAVPDDWDRDRVIFEATKRLPARVKLVGSADELNVLFFPDDDEGGLFADWRRGGPITVQESLF